MTAPTRPEGAAHAPLMRSVYEQEHMGMRVLIILYAPGEVASMRASRAAFQCIARLEDVMSDYRPASELMRLCARAGEGAIGVSEDLFSVLERAQNLSRLSDGAFDVTVGPYVWLWRNAFKTRSFPSPEALREAGALVGWRKVALDSATQSVQIEAPGMKLDLGALAKGYILDRALETLRQSGIDQALIEAGGDIVVSGSPPHREGWKIGVENAESNKRVMTLSHAAIASSGDTRQFVEFGGMRYSHIVDPRTGLGLTNQVTVTVTAPDAMTADGLATAVSILGAEQGNKLVESFPNVSAYIREVHVRPGM